MDFIAVTLKGIRQRPGGWRNWTLQVTKTVVSLLINPYNLYLLPDGNSKWSLVSQDTLFEAHRSVHRYAIFVQMTRGRPDLLILDLIFVLDANLFSQVSASLPNHFNTEPNIQIVWQQCPIRVSAVRMIGLREPCNLILYYPTSPG